ncbi:MAG: formylglycine-generating enzyme family protein [Planctomycetaceae bacterium]|nr:formylglycine-generating enzyme family protein [Planctomycetaceae bacterium]
MTEEQIQQRIAASFRYAALALYLGDPSLASSMCALGKSSDQRTAFILGLKDWPADLSHVREFLATTTDEPLRSAVCVAIGRFPKPTNPDSDATIAVLKDLFAAATDGGSHSAIDWTLRQWGVPLPDVAQRNPHTPREEASTPKGKGSAPATTVASTPGDAPTAVSNTMTGVTTGKHWYVNSVGMTFVAIPLGKHDLCAPKYRDVPFEDPIAEVEFTRAVFLSNRELTVAQFAEFVSDPKTPLAEKPEEWNEKWGRQVQEVSPTGDTPVQQISWIDSVQYCNWLSRKEGLTPCYEKVERVQKVEWSCNFEADGYRLPTTAEWEVACRAATQTSWFCGTHEAQLTAFAVCLSNSNSRTLPTGTMLPNALGLFDIHGNVFEWCHDWHEPSPQGGKNPEGPTTGSERVLRGGSWYGAAQDAASAKRFMNRPDYRDNSVGMRLAQVPSAGRPKGP